MAGAARQSEHRQSSSHIVALLSLKILLLAFFILLNALSSFEEERRAAVIDSVREAFRGLLPAERSVSANPAGVEVFEGSDTLVDALKQLFGDDLPLADLPESSGARVLLVELPARELFSGSARALEPEGAETLRLLAGVLTDPRFAQQVAQVDVLYGLPGRESSLAGNRPALLRAGLVVRALEGHGVAASRLSAGFLPGFPDQVRLHFTVRTEAPAPAAVGESQP